MALPSACHWYACGRVPNLHWNARRIPNEILSSWSRLSPSLIFHFLSVVERYRPHPCKSSHRWPVPNGRSLEFQNYLTYLYWTILVHCAASRIFARNALSWHSTSDLLTKTCPNGDPYRNVKRHQYVDQAPHNNGHRNYIPHDRRKTGMNKLLYYPASLRHVYLKLRWSGSRYFDHVLSRWNLQPGSPPLPGPPLHWNDGRVLHRNGSSAYWSLSG